MAILEQINQYLRKSILKVDFLGEKESGTDNLKMKEYFFRFGIPADHCLDNVQFSIKEWLFKELERIGKENGLTLRRSGSYEFAFFKITSKGGE